MSYPSYLRLFKIVAPAVLATTALLTGCGHWETDQERNHRINPDYDAITADLDTIVAQAKPQQIDMINANLKRLNSETFQEPKNAVLWHSGLNLHTDGTLKQTADVMKVNARRVRDGLDVVSDAGDHLDGLRSELDKVVLGSGFSAQYK